MKKTKKLFAFMLLAIITTIVASCGGDSNPSAPITPAVLSVTTASLPGATAGTAYNQTLTASNGTTPYTWSISVGTLPAGLSLNTATGAITGTPTAVATTSFTVTVTDSATPVGTATKPLSIVVGSTPPVFDALAFYTANCKGCHTLGVRSATQITNAIANFSAMSSFRTGGTNALTPSQISAIAAVSF